MLTTLSVYQLNTHLFLGDRERDLFLRLGDLDFALWGTGDLDFDLRLVGDLDFDLFLIGLLERERLCL